MNSTRWHRTWGVLSLFLSLGILAFTSCTTIKTEKQPSLQVGSPLKSLPPVRVYVAKFQDVRVPPPKFEGKAVVLPLKLDTSVVRDSVEREFKRNGHTCLGTAERDQADFIVEGDIDRYSLLFSGGLVIQEATASIGVKISVKSPRAPNDVLGKSYVGDYSVRGFILTASQEGKALDEALLNLLKEFTGDPELLAFLKRAAP